MRTALLLISILQLSVFSADAGSKVKEKARRIEALYADIKKNASPEFNKLKDAIASDEILEADLRKAYEVPIRSLEICEVYAGQIADYNAFVEKNNELVDGKQDKAKAEGLRKKRLAELEAMKVNMTTTVAERNRTSVVGSSLATTNETTVSTSRTRRDTRTAVEKANLEKEQIHDDVQAELDAIGTERLYPVECKITLAQIKALRKDQQTKLKYLLDKIQK